MANQPQRYTHLTPKKRVVFLEALMRCGNVTAAAAAAGISRDTLYNHRRRDADFAAAWEAAAELGADALEDEARRRAHDGVDEPLTCAKGLVLGEDGAPMLVKKYSDTLLIFLLKGARPQKYRDRAQVEVSGQLDINTLAAEADARFAAFVAASATPAVLGQPDPNPES